MVPIVPMASVVVVIEEKNIKNIKIFGGVNFRRAGVICIPLKMSVKTLKRGKRSLK